jgi:uncharacterized repeat protein (TIGR01451 family)
MPAGFSIGIHSKEVRPTMKISLKKLIVVSGATLAAYGATPAFAAGTTQGTSISNTATVNYNVGAVAQPSVTSAANIIVVDRKVVLSVAELGTTTTNVSVNATGQATAFRITNNSNDTIDVGLTASQIVGGTAAHGGTDTFDVTGLSLYRDVNGNGTYESGTDTAITFIDELLADNFIDILVVGSIPNSLANGSVAGVDLLGQARAGGTSGTQGAVLAATTGANTAGVDTVLSDVASAGSLGASDIANDGKSSDNDDFTVSAPTLAVTKQSRIVSDPVNLTTNPKAIPGAVVEYCIVVANSGAAAADNVAITDTLPTQTTGTASSGFLNGTYTGTPGSGTCNLDGTAGGTISATAASGNLGTVAAGATRTFYFRTTIN